MRPTGSTHKLAECLKSSCLWLRLVELGFALLNAGAQHWRNMSSVAVLTSIPSNPRNLLPPASKAMPKYSRAVQDCPTSRNHSSGLKLLDAPGVLGRPPARHPHGTAPAE